MAFYVGFLIFLQDSLIQRKKDLAVPPPVSQGELKCNVFLIYLLNLHSNSNTLDCCGNLKTPKTWK